MSCPLLSPPPDGGILAGEHRLSRPPKAANAHALRGRKVASSGAPLYRRKAYRLLAVKKGDGKNSELTLAEKGELFYNKINTWEDFL